MSEVISDDRLEQFIALLTLARRVHAERGPIEHHIYGWGCPCSIKWHVDKSEIKHADNCLWLAFDTLLRKVGEI